MLKRYASGSRLTAKFLGTAGLLILLWTVIVGLGRNDAFNPLPADRVTPTPRALIAPPTHTAIATPTPRVATSTPPPTFTPLPPTPTATLAATDTPLLPSPTVTPQPSPAELLPNPEETPASKPTSGAAKPADPNLLPNGVRYGDPRPNLPDRIVRIASPDVKLDTPVYEVYIQKGAWDVAQYAAGHHYNSANPGEGGNVVVNGHNNWKGEVFRYLEFLKPGDLIQVWTLDGQEHRYRVSDIKKLREAGVSYAQRLENAKVMNPTDHEQLTLITCWPYTTYTHRLIITALPEK